MNQPNIGADSPNPAERDADRTVSMEEIKALMAAKNEPEQAGDDPSDELLRKLKWATTTGPSGA